MIDVDAGSARAIARVTTPVPAATSSKRRGDRSTSRAARSARRVRCGRVRASVWGRQDGVLAQDRPLEPPQLRTGLEPELVVERSSGPCVHV